MQHVFEFYRDLPVRPKRPERLFFGIFPDAETSTLVERFGDQFIWDHHLAGARLRSERPHVSLHHVGDFKRLRPKDIYAAIQAGKAIAMRPFEMTFRFIKSFESAPSLNGRPRRQPWVLLGEGEALFELHEVLGVAMEKNGLRTVEHFTPHMTLSYGLKAIPMQAIEPIRCVVSGFALIHSELWLTQYNVVERWSFEG